MLVKDLLDKLQAADPKASVHMLTHTDKEQIEDHNVFTLFEAGETNTDHGIFLITNREIEG